MMRVFDKNGTFLYDINESKEIARGGEGKVIDLDANHVVKLYLPNVIPIEESKFHDLNLLDDASFIKPETLVYNDRKNILGFSMRKIPSDFFPLVSLLNKVFCSRESITLRVKTKVIEALIQGVKYAHSRNVVIGDLNPYNILVNKDGVVYFIDTDSFQTPKHVHSGIMLEDVRDFLFNGDINVNSDYFALSVLIFNLLTYVHPFKGMHKKMPKISDRMINKLSVLSNSPELIIPKCYEPITDANLMNQFTRIFNNGERFVIILGAQVASVNTIKPVNVQSATMSVKTIYHGLKDSLITSAASRELLLLYTNTGDYFIFDVSLKGSYRLLNHDKIIATNPKFFVYEKTIYCFSDNKLVQLYPRVQTVAHFTSEIKIKTQLYGSKLVIITDKTLYEYDLNIKEHGLFYSTTSVFGRGFTQIDNIYQSVSGNTVLMYHEKDSLNYAICDVSIKNLIQRGNMVLFEKIDNEKVTYSYSRISNLKVSHVRPETELRYFDLLNDDLAILPYDNKIVLARTLDMSTVLEFDCSVAATSSVIHSTNAGIVIVNNDACYLTNKR